MNVENRMQKQNILLTLCQGTVSLNWTLITFVIAILFLVRNECVDIIAVHLEVEDVQDLYFEILSPEELRYSYKIILAKNFGSRFPKTYSNIGLVPTNPIEGCGMPYNAHDLKNNIALVKRGECSFMSKAVQAEKSGALGIVIMDSEIDNDDSFIHMIDDNTDRQVNIPAVFLLGKNGYVIMNTLTAKKLPKALINIPLNLSYVPLHRQKQPPWLLW